MRTTIIPTRDMTWESVQKMVGHTVDHAHAVPLEDVSDVYHIAFDAGLIQARTLQPLSEWEPIEFVSISLDSD